MNARKRCGYATCIRDIFEGSFNSVHGGTRRGSMYVKVLFSRSTDPHPITVEERKEI